MRRATLLPLLLLTPLIFLPLRSPFESLPARALNLAIHLVVSLLSFALARRLGAITLAAPATALLFAVHPVHVEAIALTSAREELLATALSLASLLSFTFAGPWVVDGKVVLPARRTRHLFGWLGSACFVAALSASPTAICVPPLVAVLEGSFRPRTPGAARGWWSERGPVVAPIGVSLAIAALLWALLPQWRWSAGTLPRGDVGVASALAQLARHVGELFYPVRGSGSPAPTPGSASPDLVVLLAGIGLALLSLVVWYAARPFVGPRRSTPPSPGSFAALLFLASYATVAGLAQARAVEFADRRLYFPSVGFCMLLALAIGAFSAGWRPGATGPPPSAKLTGREVRLAVLTLAALVAGFSILTWTRCLEWHQPETAQDTESLCVLVGDSAAIAKARRGLQNVFTIL